MANEQNMHRLVRFVGLNRLVHPLAAFCVSIIVARSLGPEGRGEYGLFVAIVVMFPLIARFGLAAAFRYWCALGSTDRHQLLKTATVAGVLLGAIVSSVVVLGWLIGNGSFSFMPASLGPLGVVSLAVTLFLTTLTGFWKSYLNGHERYAYGTWGETAGVALQAIVLFLVWRYSVASLDIAAGTRALQVAFLFFLFPFLPDIGLNMALRARLISLSVFRRMLRYGLLTYVTNLLGLANLHMIVLLLSALSSFHETGLFAAVTGPANFLLLLGAPLTLVLSSRTTRRAKNPRFPRRIASALRLIVCLTGIAAVPGAAIAPMAIPWIFGSEFEAAVVLFQILLPGIIALSLKNIVMQYLGGSGRPGWSTIISATNAAISITLCLLLLPNHGAIGAALAVTISHLCSTVVAMVIFLRLSEVGLRELLVFQADDWLPLVRVLGLARLRRKRQ